MFWCRILLQKAGCSVVTAFSNYVSEERSPKGLCAASGFARRRFGLTTPLALLRSCSEGVVYCNRTATRLVQTSTQGTKVVFTIAENPINKPNIRTH
jgi:hypothetical protein